MRARARARVERKRERGKERERGGERERSPYMGTCADNMWQWLRGQQRSDTRQMEEIKHGTERVPGALKTALVSQRVCTKPGPFSFFAQAKQDVHPKCYMTLSQTPPSCP